MAVLLVLHMVDNLLNGMINPLFMLALGGVSAIGPAVRLVGFIPRQRRRRLSLAGEPRNRVGIVRELRLQHLEGDVAFLLHDTYGFPSEMTVEIAELIQESIAPKGVAVVVDFTGTCAAAGDNVAILNN